MKRSLIVLLVAAIPLAIAGCGGSGLTVTVSPPNTGAGLLNTPSFAEDAAAKELALSAQVAAETYATDNSGSYAGLSAKILNQYEATIQIGPGNGNSYIAGAGVKGTTNGYTVAATSTSGDIFAITRTGGTTTRTCMPSGQGGCASGGNW